MTHDTRTPVPRHEARPPSSALLIIGLLIVFCCAQSARASTIAAPAHILVLQSKPGGPYEKFTRQFRKTLEDNRAVENSHISMAIADGADVSIRLAALKTTDLLVAVGTEATEIALRSTTRAPILSVLVPRLAAEQLLSDVAGKPPHHVTLIYLDQPMSRYFFLIKLVLPKADKVGMVLGPVTAGEIAALQRAAQQIRFTVLPALVPAGSDNPLPALENILHSSDAILALPDPVVYTRYTLPPLLLMTFRYRVPVFGFSAALTKAGAIASVYSTPEQIGQQAAEMILLHELPAGGQYPLYFEVRFNQAVAQALDIALPSEQQAAAQLQESAGTP